MGGKLLHLGCLICRLFKSFAGGVAATHVAGFAWYLLRGKCLQRREEHSFVSRTSGRPIQWHNFYPVLAIWVNTAVETFQTSRALQQESLPKCDQCKLPLQGIKSRTCYPLFCKWLPSNMFCKPHSTRHTIQVRFCQLWAKHFIRLALYVPSVEQVWRTEQPVTILNIAILTRSWPKLFRGWRESILHRLLLKGKGRKVQRLSHANCSHCRGGAAGKSLNV